MTRVKWLVLTVLGASAALMLLPVAAGATVYCVDATPGNPADNVSIDPSCKAAIATITMALTTAQANTGADSVLVGPGTYTLPNSAPYELNYNDTTPANTLILRGIGQTHLTMGGTAGNQTGAFITAPQGSSVENLALTIPANADGNGDTGFRFGGGVIGRELTVNGPAATNAQGVYLASGTTLSDSTVDLPIEANPTNGAVSASSGDATITGSHLRAYTAISTSGNVVKVERTTLDAMIGAHTDGGTIEFHDSLIELGTRASAIGVQLANDNFGSLTLTTVVDGTTIVGGGANSVGIRVQANDNQETATATISNTLISGPAKPIQVLADNGRTAKATVSYSNYNGAAAETNPNLDGTLPSGTATLVSSNVTNLEPGFANAAAGDFHLARSSPLIDLGNPSAPPAGELDIDGQARAANPDCPTATGRRDIGADEFVPTCAPPSDGSAGGSVDGPGPGPSANSGPGADPGNEPTPPPLPQTTISGKHRVASTKKHAKVTFTLGSSETGASFRCSVDGKPYKSCGARFSISLKRGRHTIAAVAIGAGGTDPTPATITVKVVKKKAPAKGS